jgi:hypothetical protein
MRRGARPTASPTERSPSRWRSGAASLSGCRPTHRAVPPGRMSLAITTAANFGFRCAWQHANHDITGLQPDSSSSSASNRLSEAAVNSCRSASDQESDQSIAVSGARAASRWARADSSAAASGGRRRKASNRTSSGALIRTAIPRLQYTAVYRSPKPEPRTQNENPVFQKSESQES